MPRSFTTWPPSGSSAAEIAFSPSGRTFRRRPCSSLAAAATIESLLATGERARLISTLSIENAARFLCASDIDGIVIGDGFAARTLQAFATALLQDARFRDLPIGLVAADAAAGEWERLPNFERLERGRARGHGLHDAARAPARPWRASPAATRGASSPAACSTRSPGCTRPAHSCASSSAWSRTPASAAAALSLARFSFAPQPERTLDDRAARQVIRLARPTDIAGRADDGSILLAFPNTGLGNAHALVRRIGSTLSGSLPGVRSARRPLRSDGDARGFQARGQCRVADCPSIRRKPGCDRFKWNIG